jgi:uncharacterized protein
MLHIKTNLKPSNIHGIGVFADHFIPKGTIVWKFDPDFDIVISEESLKILTEPALEQIMNFSYIDKNTYERILCADNIRFCNHFASPNLIHDYSKSKYGETFASKDINDGEELTLDYQTFELDSEDRDIKKMDKN